VIQVSDLRKTYGEGREAFPALRGIDLRVADKEFVAVMGPSGCGKSTLLSLLGLLDRPSGGIYRLNGRDASGLGDDERTLIRRDSIGFVFQAFNLLPRMSSQENVALPMAYAGVPRGERLQRASELLHKVGLGSKLRRTPLELSGGERQRVCIARALANSPLVLLADEPTGNLDSRTAGEILDLFELLHGEGRTMVVVTHDRAVAGRAARVLHMADGKVTREEAPA
jgi:ABC-type lipoprotein export system ATPase subunit